MKIVVVLFLFGTLGLISACSVSQKITVQHEKLSGRWYEKLALGDSLKLFFNKCIKDDISIDSNGNISKNRSYVWKWFPWITWNSKSSLEDKGSLWQMSESGRFKTAEVKQIAGTRHCWAHPGIVPKLETAQISNDEKNVILRCLKKTKNINCSTYLNKQLFSVLGIGQTTKDVAILALESDFVIIKTCPNTWLASGDRVWVYWKTDAVVGKDQLAKVQQALDQAEGNYKVEDFKAVSESNC